MPEPESEKFCRINQTPTLAQPILRSGRVILRPFQMEDAAAVNDLLSDREIAANTRDIPFPYSLALARDWIKPQRKNWEIGKAAVFAICVAESNTAQLQLVGAIGLEIESLDERAELGYWIGKQFWGNGYCTDSTRLMIRFGFETLALNRIYAYHLIRNSASGRVMEKAGMTQEGTLKQHTKKWGKFEDVCIWGAVAGDYREQEA